MAGMKVENCRGDRVRMSELKKQSAESEWRGNLAALAGIMVLGVITYAHTLNVPWYMDDLHAIVENRAIHRLQDALNNFFYASRGIADLTFALNYRLGGTNVVGYHLVNIAIHLVTSCLVFLLFKRVFRDRLLLALGGALVFVAHPLQTQAVTYIVQRMTSLAALFFFLALYLYVLAQEVSEQRATRHWLLYGGALLCGALAVFIKQNTAVLPVAIILFDRYFSPCERRLPWRRLLWSVAPFALVPAGLAVKSLLLPLLTGEGIANVGGMPDLVHLQHLSSLNYLVTEFSVIWLYLRLMFFPLGQALDYDYPIVATIWELKSLVALLGIAALLAAAAFLRKRLPHVSAGILWFFLALVVESTIIPLDPVFEHRLYIPMFGFAVVVMAGIARLPRWAAMVAVVLVVMTLAGLTWNRNALWNDPRAFYEDNLRRAPSSERVHLDLGNVYRKEGRLAEAQSLYERGLEINPNYVLLHINLSIIYTKQKNYQKAIDILLEGIRRNPSHFRLYNNLGVLYNSLGKFRDAATYLKKGAVLEPYNATVQFNLGMAYDRLGQLDEAIFHYRRAIDLNPSDPTNYFNLGVALFGKDALRPALQAFRAAYRLNPRHAGTQYNIALVYLALGDLQSASSLAAQLQNLNSEMAKNLELRIKQGR
jgi:tetratricopeptide (TPR) repeat protein